MKKFLLPILFIGVTLVWATTFHTLPFNGTNTFADDEDFPTSTDTIFAYCTWDDHYLYLAYSGDFLASPNDTVRSNVDMFWYIDTDPHPDNPLSGNGTDSTGAYYTQIMPSFPWWFDEQSWTLPFYADYRIQGDYDRKDSVYAHIQSYNDAEGRWNAKVDLDTSMANLNYVDGYYELRIPLDSLGNPPDIFILGHLVSNEWKSDLTYDPDPQREVGGTLGSWPWSSIRGGDGDHNEDGHFDHWFHFHLQPGISPDQENDPPVVSDIPDQEINKGETFQTIDLNAYVFDDITPDTLLSWTTSGNQHVTITILDSNQAQITIDDPNWTGSDTVLFVCTDQGGKSDSDTVVFTVNGTSAIGEGESTVPKRFTVLPNYPNPFNPTTTLRFGLARRSDVRIKVYNILGETVLIRQLKNMSPGFHRLKLNAASWPAGIYFYRISAENRSIVKKMVLVK